MRRERPGRKRPSDSNVSSSFLRDKSGLERNAQSGAYRNPQQQQVAESYIKQLTAANTYSRPIVTQVAKLGGFYPAEEYHQHYLAKNPYQPYIVINDQPKVAALKKQFADVWQN